MSTLTSKQIGEGFAFFRPDRARRRSKCFYCGWTFGPHRPDCPGPLKI